MGVLPALLRGRTQISGCDNSNPNTSWEPFSTARIDTKSMQYGECYRAFPPTVRHYQLEMV